MNEQIVSGSRVIHRALRLRTGTASTTAALRGGGGGGSSLCRRGAARLTAALRLTHLRN